jgi:creatinine amidohydrolase/Fe(II)-dependent formamide hydrolase-like protein
MKLKELKATDFKEGQKYDFLFPIGATEQHGPFIPFGTDTYITDYLVEQVAKEFPDLIILPTLEVSRSQEHRGFYGTLWLTEETLKAVMYDICNSLKDQARNIFITSFHANDPYINSFIQTTKFDGVNIVNLDILDDQDDDLIEKTILNGPFDGHAGNSEISNMLHIDKNLVKIPPSDYPKTKSDHPFKTDNLVEFCPDGIADNHPKWIPSAEIGNKILDIYASRMIKNLKSLNN